jgi:hypothetical protein
MASVGEIMGNHIAIVKTSNGEHLYINFRHRANSPKFDAEDIMSFMLHRSFDAYDTYDSQNIGNMPAHLEEVKLTSGETIKQFWEK